MFPFRTSSIFRSRWIALLWSAGIISTALSLVPDRQQQRSAAASSDMAAQPERGDATGAPVSDEQLRQARNMLETIAR
jgi:hypothetical protein